MSKFVIPQKCDIPKGAYGVWQIPELKISVPVYQPRTNTTKDAQQIVDADNSATYRKFGAGHIIEDHAGSAAGRGTWDIGKVLPDMVGFLITERKTERYICNRAMRAVRQANSFICDGVGVWPRSKTDILCDSCATADAKEVYLAVFKFNGVMP